MSLGTVKQIADGMHALVRDPGLVSRLGTSAQQRAAREFSTERVTSLVLDFYDQAMRG